jgi:acetolactate synthase-1/2/3 large subunit
MKRSGAWLAVRALERLGIRYTFGIPGVHNTELYDELDSSEAITPILVTHEGCGAFMADAISRTSDSVGCLAIVPAAGMTHAMSGIGEAFLDGIPMLVISGGIRRDTGRHYQLHDIDQQRVLDGITKAAFLIDSHRAVIPTLYAAYDIATTGEPGPVFIEIAGNVLMFDAEVEDEIPERVPEPRGPAPEPEAMAEALAVLRRAEHPGIYLGWGARDATAAAIEIAEALGAPVATTLQGLSVFPADHPLHVGMGWGNSSVPAARKAFSGCDAVLAVGVRFAELATGSYGMEVPADLVHVDINPEVFDRNYPARVKIEADAALALPILAAALRAEGVARDSTALRETIRREKESFHDSWTSGSKEDLVSPGIFFAGLRERLDRDAFMVVDDGNHTFLAAEQFPVYESRHFISPTDFNCMGYCVPATIGTKLANPDKQVVGVCGDGAFMMTGLELVTAASLGVGVVLFVFHDGELAQISQFQQIPLNRKTCTVLGKLNVEGVAVATGAEYLAMDSDAEVGEVIEAALTKAAAGAPVIVDVKIDYSRRSAFTTGVVKTNLGRFPLRQKLRYVGRAIKRRIVD